MKPEATAKVRTQSESRLPDSLYMTLAAGVLLLVVWLLQRYTGVDGWLLVALYAIPYSLAAAHIVESAIQAARRRRFDIDALMLLAALGAAAIGDFVEGGLLLFLFGMGHALEHRAMRRARNAITDLKDLAPDVGHLVVGDRVQTVPVEQLKVGDTLLVRAGERIPADGEVVSGLSSVNQAPVTGESVPVLKEAGAGVYAGTINGEGAITITMTEPPENSTIARVVKTVQEARVNKAPSQRFAERFTSWFAPAALLVSVLTILVPWLFGMEFLESARRGITVLVVMSPCALGLSAPSAILAGLGRAAQGGVLVKGGLALEAAGIIKTVVFDKTGTLTHGSPVVVRTEATDGNRDALLRLAGTVEQPSAHPLAMAIVREAGSDSLANLEHFESVTGFGVRGVIDGAEVLVGGQRLLETNGVTVPDQALQLRRELEEQGSTVVLVSNAGHYAGLIELRDTLRANAAGVVSRLHDMGIERTILLTGDNAAAAGLIAKVAGIDEVIADALPEDKASKVSELEAAGERVAMIGDGVNDAPAMATASLGIAMGGAGTDLALETADMVLMSDDIGRLPFAFGLARATRKIVISNIIISLGMVFALVPVAMAGGLHMTAAVILHEGSTLLVIFNALRLLGFERSRSRETTVVGPAAGLSEG